VGGKSSPSPAFRFAVAIKGKAKLEEGCNANKRKAATLRKRKAAPLTRGRLQHYARGRP
jgi:hypothetical protein